MVTTKKLGDIYYFKCTCPVGVGVAAGFSQAPDLKCVAPGSDSVPYFLKTIDKRKEVKSYFDITTGEYGRV